MADTVVVPAGYTATVLYALGDPLTAATPDFRNDGTDTDFDNRAGDHHDGMEYFGLNAAGTARDVAGSERGLLAMNHEAPDRPASCTPPAPRPARARPPRPTRRSPRTACRSSKCARPAAAFAYRAGLRLQPPRHAADADRAQRPGARQRADEDEVFARRHDDPRHHQQLRHRHTRPGAPTSPARRTGPATSRAAPPTTPRAAAPRQGAWSR